MIWIYRHTLSPLVGYNCRHLPTCSVYGDEAIERFGLWGGGWMTLARLLRCQPWGTSGIDNVPLTRPAGARWYLPWRFGRWRGVNGPELLAAALSGEIRIAAVPGTERLARHWFDAPREGINDALENQPQNRPRGSRSPPDRSGRCTGLVIVIVAACTISVRYSRRIRSLHRAKPKRSMVDYDLCAAFPKISCESIYLCNWTLGFMLGRRQTVVQRLVVK